MNVIGKIISRYKRDGISKASRRYIEIIKGACYRFLEKRILPLIFQLERKLPIRKHIVFECENDMDDNPRAVYEYLLKIDWNKNHRLVWIVRDVQLCKRLYMNKNVVFLSRFDQSFMNQVLLEYYLSTAKWFVFSHPYWFKKRRQEQIIIHTNHGTPFKGLSEKDDPNIGKSFDFLLSSSESVAEKNSEVWCCSMNKVFVCGMPRIDFLTEGRKEDIFPSLFSWHEKDRVILCMPTYKQSTHSIDSKTSDPYSLDVVKTEGELRALNQYLEKNNTHLLVKPHPLQITDDLFLNSLSNIHYINNDILLQKQIILYELIGCCDSLITDCSSVFFDFMLLNRPIGFLMNNVKDYGRGFIYEEPEQYMPGEKIYNYDDLIKYVNDVSCGIDRYHEERKKVSNYINGQNQSHNSEKFLDIMFKLSS